MITEALEAVSVDIFPHRALENQKLWMRRSICKPKDMSFRKMASALTRMNAKLIRFPGADEDDLFSTGELLEILEWSLPSTSRSLKRRMVTKTILEMETRIIVPNTDNIRRIPRLNVTRLKTVIARRKTETSLTRMSNPSRTINFERRSLS